MTAAVAEHHCYPVKQCSIMLLRLLKTSYIQAQPEPVGIRPPCSTVERKLGPASHLRWMLPWTRLTAPPSLHRQAAGSSPTDLRAWTCTCTLASKGLIAICVSRPCMTRSAGLLLLHATNFPGQTLNVALVFDIVCHAAAQRASSCCPAAARSCW